ncbi:hypothetical protein N5A92_15175 [Chelativorans sp. EGI FJ00035]|uniref:YunG n=1 Tax=Chelativorans salis TaxID=2978478 RepID=A0ABT2LP84_9HYPH|nr:hypothetical protein [Chelativorans sp. EGI FJ00035]MCT7376375.1 hypothetical protein [Chelativorans sp. EGI FJ00035]
MQAFEEHLRSAWSAESSGKWSAENPASGQCSVTALVVQDLFGGEILKTETPAGSHFYNRIGGRRWDFTLSQFGRPILFDDTPSSRQEALADTTPAQYEALKARLGTSIP